MHEEMAKRSYDDLHADDDDDDYDDDDNDEHYGISIVKLKLGCR